MKLPRAVAPSGVLLVAWCASCSGDRTTLVWDDSSLADAAPSQSGAANAGSSTTSPSTGGSPAAPSDNSASGGGVGGRAESLGGVGAGGSAEVSEGGAPDVTPGGAAGSPFVCPTECCGSPDLARDDAVEIIADSERGFSGTQGQCGWSYGYFPSGAEPFTLLATYDATNSGSPVWEVSKMRPPWLMISARGQHPNLIPLGWIARRWTSGVGGEIEIRGRVAMTDPSAGADGVVASVRVAGKERWQLALASEDVAGKDFALSAEVEVGTIVDFIVAPQSGDAHDATAFSVVITR